MDKDTEALGGKGFEGTGQRGGVFSGDFGAGEAGELSAEAAHAGFEPVAFVIGHAGGDEIDEAGTVSPDDGHDEGGKHDASVGMLAGSRKRGGGSQREGSRVWRMWS